MSQHRKNLIDLIRAKSAGPDGEWEDLSLRELLSTGRRLRAAALVLSEWIELHVTGIPTVIVCPCADEMLAHVLVSRAVTDMKWASIGIDDLDVPTDLTDEDRVVIVAGMVTTGTAVRDTYDGCAEAGAEVLAVIPLIDRAGIAQGFFEAIGVDYWPVITHYDLDLPPLAQGVD